MKKTIIWIVIGGLTLLLVGLLVLGPAARSAPAIVAFELEQSTPTPNEQVLFTATPASTAGAAVGIPQTGATSGAPLPSSSSFLQIRDQMCVRKIPYTVLALPSGASFAVDPSTNNANRVTCKSVLNMGGVQTIVCTGPADSNFTLHVTNNALAEDFTIPLKGCGTSSDTGSEPQPTAPAPQSTEVAPTSQPQPTGTEAPLPTLPISTP